MFQATESVGVERPRACSGALGDSGPAQNPIESSESAFRSGGFFTLRGLLQIAGPFLVATVAIATLNRSDLSSFVLVLSISSLGALTNPAISSVLYRFRELTEPSGPAVSSFVFALVSFGSALTALGAAVLVGFGFALPVFLLSMFSGVSTAVSADLGRMKFNTLVAKRTSLQSLVATGVGSAALLVGRDLSGYLFFTCLVNGLFCWWLVVECHQVAPIRLTRRLRRSDVRSVFSHVAVILAWIPLVFVTSGADVFFVKAFDRQRVAAYGIGVRVVAAASLPLIVAAAMIPAALIRRDLGTGSRLQFRLYSRIAGLAGTLVIAVAALVVPPVMSRLPIDASSVPNSNVLAFIGLAAAIRGTWTAANLMMLQRGNHLRTLWPGSLETLVSLAVTIAAGRRWGEVGVAAGTLAGSIASFAGYFVVCSKNDALDTVGWKSALSDLSPNIAALGLFGLAIATSPLLVLPVVGGYCVYVIRHEVRRVQSFVDNARRIGCVTPTGQPC